MTSLKVMVIEALGDKVAGVVVYDPIEDNGEPGVQVRALLHDNTVVDGMYLDKNKLKNEEIVDLYVKKIDSILEGKAE